jgi:hypothetical protein
VVPERTSAEVEKWDEDLESARENFELTSETLLESGDTIRHRYTCEGEDISPPLSWSHAPEDTAAFALVCEDPDAPDGTFIHWLYYNIPAYREELPEEIADDPTPLTGGLQGRNDFDNVGYGGPCPPTGSTHRYYFRLYALGDEVELPPGASRDEILEAIEDLAIASAEIMGRYGRS